MQEIKIVSGLNYGDESKGLVAATLSTSNSLTIFSSNSCQRSHTVIHDGKRHAFRHFGSGTFKGAATYFADGFHVNPSMFRKEWEQLKEMGVEPKVYCNFNCPVITPIDMFANVYIEEQRGPDRKSSTGCGAWEAMKRLDSIYRWATDCGISDYGKAIGNFNKSYLRLILQYYSNNLEDSEIVRDFLSGGALIDNILDDVEFFRQHVEFIKGRAEEEELLKSYPLLVFENSQGLLLDSEITLDLDYSTPASVGARNPANIIYENFLKEEDEYSIENFYVTRTYFTRHGKGNIGKLGECKKAEINPDMFDYTNVQNPNQGILRFGKIGQLDALLMRERIIYDSHKLDKCGDYKNNIVITHTNEFENEKLMEIFKSCKDIGLYTSDNEINIKFEKGDL